MKVTVHFTSGIILQIASAAEPLRIKRSEDTCETIYVVSKARNSSASAGTHYYIRANSVDYYTTVKRES